MFDNGDLYFIAEVGQNHQGDLETALTYVTKFAEAGADAIKFQMRDNRRLFHKDKYNSIYNSENAFGETYGQHREALELSVDEMKCVRKACREQGVDFICTPFDETSLDNLLQMDPDGIKVASFDLGNLPFLKKIAKAGLPVVISTGGGDLQAAVDSVDVLKEGNCPIAVLHCVSKYPCPAEELLLGRIEILMKNIQDVYIGSSDHFNGILSGPVAYMLGARVFEKHVSLDRSQKGTDHSFSLEREGFRKFVRDVKRTEMMLDTELPSSLGEEPVFKKLGKSVASAKDISAGEVITDSMLTGIIFDTTVIPVRESKRVLGSMAKVHIPKGTALSWDDLIVD